MKQGKRLLLDLVGEDKTREIIEEMEEIESLVFSRSSDFDNAALRIIEKARDIVFPEFLLLGENWGKMAAARMCLIIEEYDDYDLRNTESFEYFSSAVMNFLRIKESKEEFFKKNPLSFSGEPKIDFLPFLLLNILDNLSYSEALIQDFLEATKEYSEKIPAGKLDVFIAAVDVHCGDYLITNYSQWKPTKQNLELVLSAIVFAIADIGEEDIPKIFADENEDSICGDYLFSYSKKLSKFSQSNGEDNEFFDVVLYMDGSKGIHTSLKFGLLSRALADGIEDLGMDALASIYDADL